MKEVEKSEEILGKKMEKYDYFPFTHGYEIEQKQKELNKRRKDDMNQLYKTQDMRRVAKNQKNLTIGDVSEISLSDGNPRAIPLSFYADYPIFLKPHKHYPYRRMKDEHVEDVMNDALQRYERKLLTLE